jgi:O-acetyl-ADP-ribose deacetylase (regulator of RNase III)
MERKFSQGKRLQLVVGDITRVAADAIVNAANSALAGGGGVDGAIHRAGGVSIMRELDRIRAATGGCPTGSAVVTGAGLLPARFVFHAVGPVYRDGKRGEPDSLASCYRTCLALAEQHGGEGGHEAARSDLRTVQPGRLRRVRECLVRQVLA